MMLIAHITDPHLKPEGAKRDEETGINARFLDRVDSLRFAINDARERGCGYILFGGDLFGGDNREEDDPNVFYGNGAYPRPYMIMAAIEAFQLAHDIPIIAIEGNHDQPKAQGEPSALAPVIVALPNAGLSYVPETIDCSEFQVVTLPSPKRSQLAALVPNYAELSVVDANNLLGEALLNILEGHYALLDHTRPSILLAHVSLAEAELRGIPMVGRDVTLSAARLPAFTFSAFGHVHAAQGFSKAGRPEVFITGSTDRCDFGEEGQAKCYTIIDTEKDTWYPVEIPCREYKTFHLSLFDTDSGWWSEDDLKAKDAICRVKINRPQSVKPDLAGIERDIRAAGCFDFYGITEIVEREAGIRSEAVTQAANVDEQLAAWHEATDCKVPLPELQTAAAEIERQAA